MYVHTYDSNRGGHDISRFLNWLHVFCMGTNISTHYDLYEQIRTHTHTFSAASIVFVRTILGYIFQLRCVYVYVCVHLRYSWSPPEDAAIVMHDETKRDG